MRERRLRQAIVGVALVGACVTAYLVYVHYSGGRLACSTGGCETVQNSSYSTLAGVPVALLGLLAYLGVLASALVTGELARAAGTAISLAGVGFGLYLLYVQIAVIHAICEWCVGSDGLMTVLALLTLVRVRSAGSYRQSRATMSLR